MSHLAQAERYHISLRLQAAYTQAEIAAALSRAPSTISRELQRNSTSGRYDPDQAQKRADRRRNQASSGMRVDRKVMAAVQDKVRREHWSPQTAVGRLYKETGIRISVQTVYNHLAALPRSLGRFVKRYRPRGRRELRNQTGLQMYFTDPYCAYQKGTVEHFIGGLRRKLPKRTDFSKLTKRGVKQVEHRLNNRPLKVLGYRTPKEVYTSCSSVAFHI